MNVISKMLAGVLLSLPVLSFAETHTLQTYYPAPTGIYNTVTVTSNTVLGRNGGIVTVASSANASELNVNGPVKINGGVLVPARLASDPTASSQLVEGAIYYNTTTQTHRIYSAGAWKEMSGGFYPGAPYPGPLTKIINGITLAPESIQVIGGKYVIRYEGILPGLCTTPSADNTGTRNATKGISMYSGGNNWSPLSYEYIVILDMGCANLSPGG